MNQTSPLPKGPTGPTSADGSEAPALIIHPSCPVMRRQTIVGRIEGIDDSQELEHEVLWLRVTDSRVRIAQEEGMPGQGAVEPGNAGSEVAAAAPGVLRATCSDRRGFGDSMNWAVTLARTIVRQQAQGRAGMDGEIGPGRVDVTTRFVELPVVALPVPALTDQGRAGQPPATAPRRNRFVHVPSSWDLEVPGCQDMLIWSSAPGERMLAAAGPDMEQLERLISGLGGADVHHAQAMHRIVDALFEAWLFGLVRPGLIRAEMLSAQSMSRARYAWLQDAERVIARVRAAGAGTHATEEAAGAPFAAQAVIDPSSRTNDEALSRAA